MLRALAATSLAGIAGRFAWAETGLASDLAAVAAPLRLGPMAVGGVAPRWRDADAAAFDQALGSADRHGIDASAVRRRCADLAPGRARDTLLTRAALAYAAALASGLVDPAEVFAVYTLPRSRADVAGGLRHALRAGGLQAWLDGLAPQDEAYAKLSAAYLDACASLDDPRPPQVAPGPTIRPGQPDARTPLVAARLTALGFDPAAMPASAVAAATTAIAETAALAAERLAASQTAFSQTAFSQTAFSQAAASQASGETLTGPTASVRPGADLDAATPAGSPPAPAAPAAPPPSPDTVLGPALVAAVTAYQRANGLRDDGEVGPDTLAMLNAGPADRARVLALNLERRRWLVRTPAATRIDVNLPAQTLVFFEDGQPAWTTRVAVGRVDDQTPDLQARFSDLVVNPPWHVPSSIVRTEIAGRGQAYLRAHHMHWRDGVLVQTPGPWASLGLVKFDLRDPYDIYLHDTPVKGVFDDSARDLSHGCVRVEGAVAFARRLADRDGEGPRFDADLASGQTRSLGLGAPITVRLLYHTAFVDDQGQVTYRQDIYGRDAVLAAALDLAPLQPPSAPPA